MTAVVLDPTVITFITVFITFLAIAAIILGVLWILHAFRGGGTSLIPSHARCPAAFASAFNFAAWAFVIFAFRSYIPMIVLIAGLIGAALGLVSSVRLAFERKIYLRPRGWEHIGAFKWWKRFDDLEFIWSGIGGPRQQTWQEDAVRIVKNGEHPVLLERLEIEASGGKYVAHLSDGLESEAARIEPGAEEEIRALWWFNRPLEAICKAPALVRLMLSVGKGHREVRVEVEPQ